MKRIKKTSAKTVSIRVPEEYFNKLKEKSAAQNVSMSDVLWSELTDRKAITSEQERFLVKSYLVANKVNDKLMDWEDSEDKKIIEVVDMWRVVNDELEELMVSLFGEDIVYSPRKKKSEESLFGEELDKLYKK